MKKINVIVKEKTILELTENASKGDIIDLADLIQVDTTFLDLLIENEKDKIYQNKLAEAKNIFDTEHQNKIHDLENQINSLKKDYEKDLILKEREVEQKYQENISSLKAKIDHINSEMDTKIKQKELELQNRFNDEISQLKNDKTILLLTKESEIKALKIQADLDKKNELDALKDSYEEKIKKHEETILNLQRQKSNMNVKQIGEDLEAWCNNEVLSYMQNGFYNCTWEKDNKIVKQIDDTKGSKADYIFRIFSNNEHTGKELTSICLDMKDENPDSTKKQTNEHYYKKLDENRQKKECQYAVLVSNLEMDKPNIIPIYKVNEYPNMYVVRPGYLMVFLNMVVSLTMKFKELTLNQNLREIELKEKMDLVEEFNQLKLSYLDKPLELLDKQINDILKSSENIKKASRDIDESCQKIIKNYINSIEAKISKFEIKLNKIY